MEELLQLLEDTANMLRGMTMDPAIPAHAKDAMRARIVELDAAIAREQQLREACLYSKSTLHKKGFHKITDLLSLATKPDDSTLRAWGAKLLRWCYNNCESLSDLMDKADELEGK